MTHRPLRPRIASVPLATLASLALALALACSESAAPPLPCAEASEPIPVLETPVATPAVCPDPPTIQSVTAENVAQERADSLEAARAELLDPGQVTVVTCGIGSPIPSPAAQSCTAVFANGRFLLFDAGDGAARAIEAQFLPTDALEAIFVTHFHSDHVSDIGEVVSRSWILGREGSVPVHGIEGVERIVDGYNLVYAADNAYRRAHHTDALFPPNTEGAHAVVIPPPDPDGSMVYESGGVRVFAFEVNHAPIPALGYRVEYGGRSVVISGDTTDTPTFRTMAQGADILVSEVLSTAGIEGAECAMNRLGETRNETIFRDIRTYHISATELGVLAEATGVGQLVLTHQVPYVDSALLRNVLFVGPITQSYGGTVIAATDGTRVSVAVP